MRKNQKYSKEQMFMAIEMWQESGMTQQGFCKRENLAAPTFSYWLRKYREEKGDPKTALKKPLNKPDKPFIPLEVPMAPELVCQGQSDNYRIAITCPNGVQINCPADMDMQKLKTLLGI